MGNETSKPTYADLFAGCGGLSLGLEGAGFRRVAAIEISPDAALSYYNNLICREESSGYLWSDFIRSGNLQVASGLIVGDIAERLDDFISSCAPSSINLDLVAGGPPCQGFSVAGRRDPNDPRNTLIDYVVEATVILQPRVVLMENVPAINLPFNGDKHVGSALEILSKKLREQHYVTSVFHLKSSVVGVPQDRVRLFLMGIQREAFDSLPEYLRLLWQVEDGLAGLIQVASHVPTVREALIDIGPDGYRHLSPSEYEAFPYAKSLRFGRELAVPTLSEADLVGGDRLHNHELRSHKPDTTARFELYLYLKSLGLDGHLLNRATVLDKDQIACQIRGGLEKNGFCGREADGLVQELTEKVFKFRTKKHTQIVLDANSPARTVTTLPDDLIHYNEPRVLSVRELARLQSFPDSFVFKGKPTTGGSRRRIESPQYSQVGNAVPPLMARAVGRLVRSLLECTAASSNPDKVELKSGDSTNV